MEKEITSFAEYQEEIKEGLVLVDFYAEWCGPCKMLSPIIEEIAEEHPELKVLRVNVDVVPDLAANYSISSIPTLIRIENGHVVASKLGYMPKANVLAFLGLK